MVSSKTVNEIVEKWLFISQRDLLMARQGMTSENVITEAVCCHCQQTAEKALKAFLVMHQAEFPKTHNIMLLLKLCADISKDFMSLEDADNLTDFAVEIRYPDDWYEPSIEEAKEAIRLAEKVYSFVSERVSTVL